MVIDPQDLKIVKKILQEHAAKFEVRAFGSRVHQKHLKEFSDLDLVVMTNKPLSLTQHAKLKTAFSDSDLPFRVDVVDWAATDKSFQKLIEEKYEVVQKPN